MSLLNLFGWSKKNGRGAGICMRYGVRGSRKTGGNTGSMRHSVRSS